MNLDISTVISVLSLILAISVFVSNLRRSNKKDTQADASQFTTVIVKLENIGNDIGEIKVENKEFRADIRAHSEKLVEHEQKIKALEKTVFKKE